VKATAPSLSTASRVIVAALLRFRFFSVWNVGGQ
jgi:hypothetical protein